MGKVNVQGAVVSIASLGAGVATYAVCSHIYGDTFHAKGVAWIVAGVGYVLCDVLALVDLFWSLPRLKWLTRWSGGTVGLPVFTHGILALGGGISFLIATD